MNSQRTFTKCYSLCAIFTLSFIQFFAQTIDPLNSLQLAKQYYDSGDIKDALNVYLNIIASDKLNAEANFMAGKCYEMTPEKDKAIEKYLKANELNTNISPDILFCLGRAYHLNDQFDEAIQYYKKFKTSLNAEKAQTLKSTLREEYIKIEKRILECENAKIIYNNPFNHNITNLKELNTEYPEYTPVITSDNNIMYFISKRPGGISELKDKDNYYFEDIWYSTKFNGTWTVPKNIGLPINSESHDGCIALSPKGNELFLYKTINGGDIFFSNQKREALWSKPEGLGKNINTKYKEPSVSISTNGKTLYFSSDRPGGFGGLDIYRCEMQKSGEWSDPVNLGSLINTEYDEDSPFIDTDGKTLYFSSSGHNNMGGYDIFSTNYDVKRMAWSIPLNIGYPINSPDNDIYFVIAGDHKTAYYSSSRKGGLGDKDLYQIGVDTNYAEKSKNVLALTNANLSKHIPSLEAFISPSTSLSKVAGTTLFKGKVIDSKTKLPVARAIILIKKVHTKEQVHQFNTAQNGTFEIPLKSGFDYSIDVEKDGYLFFSDNLDIPKTNKNQIYSEVINLKKPLVGEKIVLKNVFFKTGSPYLNLDSRAELDILYEIMLKYPKMMVEVSGHTDNIGPDDINKNLSEARAKAVYEYLVKKGLPTFRLTFVGYGSDKPIGDNYTESGRTLNRRTEFEIVQN